MMPRPSKPMYYLNIARAVAERSPCLRAKYGAIIVKDDVIVATGYNGPPRGTINCDEIGCIKDALNLPHLIGYEICPAVHAEENAITNAARSGSSVLGGVLYLYGYDPRTGQTFPPERMIPCLRCRRKIINAGIVSVIVPNGDGWRAFDVAEWVTAEKEKYLTALKLAREGASLDEILEKIK